MSQHTPQGEKRITAHPVLHNQEDVEWIRFTFNGRPMMAKRGEMISSALFANGVRVFNKHHRDGEPQGIFCANGQCAQCLLLADGKPVKSCIVPVVDGMTVELLDGLPELPADDEPGRYVDVETRDVEVLIVGGGPAGLSAAAELAAAGIDILIVDDKHELGGKLGLQTHNFFGSVRDCHAGERGMVIGNIMADNVEELQNVDVWLNSPCVGVFSDGLVGIVKDDIYQLIRPKHLLITTGAREKTLAFPGCDLPGIYGAGAFQTLVNRDLIKAADRLFIVGGGNVGLIGAYHALQAGIEVAGIVEALPECGGYKVHLDKILRLGVPVWTRHTILRAEGNGRVERVTIAEVDSAFAPVAGTEKEFEIDTLLVAVGLAPVNELLTKARDFGFDVFAAGDADTIAEASAAIFSGKIVGRRMLRAMGYDIEVPDEWEDILSVLRAKPGPTGEFKGRPGEAPVYPMIRCTQEIPCNPCTSVCVRHGIVTSNGQMTGTPSFITDDCLGCTRCVAICPGLAITLVDRKYDPEEKLALVTLPWELPEHIVSPGDEVRTVGFEGGSVGSGKVKAIRDAPWQNERRLLLVEVPAGDADLVAGIRLYEPREPKKGRPLAPDEEMDTIVCRCERVTRSEIISYIRETGTTDFNALKAALRVGMGPCGGKTCVDLVMRIFRQELGRDAEVMEHIERPFTQEVPMSAFLIDKEKGGGASK